MTRPPLSERRRTHTRREIAESAVTLFARDGYDNVSVEEPPAVSDVGLNDALALLGNPDADSETSMPLAFQNRVLVVISFWYGASMKIFNDSSSRSASRV